jgi:hypothetical protein
VKKKTGTNRTSGKAKQVRKRTGAKRKDRTGGARQRRVSERTWIVTPSPERPIGEVARDLARAGLRRPRVLKAAGSIIGSAGDDAVSRLRRVRGVAVVEPDTSIDIGPPGSPTTW